MSAGTKLVLILVSIFIGYLAQLAKVSIKLFVVAGIFWGFLLSLSQVPSAKFSLWQSSLKAEGLAFWGAEYIEWVASNWWQILAILVFLASIRNSRSINLIEQTSGHAAFLATSLEKYLDITASSENLQKLDFDFQSTPSLLFAPFLLHPKFWKRYLANKAFRILSGVAFLPDDVYPTRNGEKVKFESDWKNITK